MKRSIESRLPESDEHFWVRRRLAAAATGLLEDQDEARLQTHLSTCSECAAGWQEQMQALQAERLAGDDGGDQHLPAAMIARWPLAIRSLRGLEREAVRSHLARCGECRADLTALGFKPEMAAVTVLRTRRSFGSGVAWGAGTAAVAALVAGLILLPGQAPDESGVLPWVAPVALRGSGPASLDLAPDATGFAILASVPAEIDRQQPAQVTVFGPAGASVLQTEVAPPAMAGRTLSIVIRKPQGIAAGEYRVQFSQAGPAGETLIRELAFKVVVPGP